MNRLFTIKSYGKNGLVQKDIEDNGHDLFIYVGDTEFRFSPDADGNLTLLLINGHDIKVTTERGYPAVKFIGRSRKHEIVKITEGEYK